MTKSQQHPCYQCTERTVGNDAGCHASCEKYQLWKRAHDAQQEALRRSERGNVEAGILIDKKYRWLRKWLRIKKGGGQR